MGQLRVSLPLSCRRHRDRCRPLVNRPTRRDARAVRQTVVWKEVWRRCQEDVSIAMVTDTYSFS